jgi:hypothetical protein
MTSRRGLRAGVLAGAVALAGCGDSPSQSTLERALPSGGGRVLHLPVRPTALFEAGDLDGDGTDDLLLAAGSDDQLLAWTSRRRALTRLSGAKVSDSEAGSYPVAAGAGGIVLTGARLSWVAARRSWPAAVRPVVLDPGLYRPQGAAADGVVLVVDARGRIRIVRTGGASRVPIVRATRLSADGAVGAGLHEFAFTRGRENWLLRDGSPQRLAGSAENEFAQLIAPFGARALTVVLRETDGLPDQQRTQRLFAKLVDKSSTADTRPLDAAIDSTSRATRHGLAVIDRANRHVTVLDVRAGRIRALAIPNCVGIADKDGGVAILRPSGRVELLALP